jgi:hypothetical protein
MKEIIKPSHVVVRRITKIFNRPFNNNESVMDEALVDITWMGGLSVLGVLSSH